MTWYEQFEALFISIAGEVNMTYGRARKRDTGGFILADSKNSLRFSYFLARDGKMEVLLHCSGSPRPIGCGGYTLEELSTDKPRRAIITKILENRKK